MTTLRTGSTRVSAVSGAASGPLWKAVWFGTIVVPPTTTSP